MCLFLVQSFTSCIPQVQCIVVPQAVINFLVSNPLDWGSPSWMRLFYRWAAVSTLASYALGWRSFATFCSLLWHHCQFPKTWFVASLCTCQSQPPNNTILFKCSPLMQIGMGFPDLSLSSFPRLCPERDLPDYQRPRQLPVTIDILRRIHTVWFQSPILYKCVILCVHICKIWLPLCL